MHPAIQKPLALDDFIRVAEKVCDSMLNRSEVPALLAQPAAVVAAQKSAQWAPAILCNERSIRGVLDPQLSTASFTM